MIGWQVAIVREASPMLKKLASSEGAICYQAIERQPAILDQRQSGSRKDCLGEAPPRHRLIDPLCLGQPPCIDDSEGTFHVPLVN